eukprot:TRINITY_DN16238_c0_g1_i3.p1 TRINITY_DN16238_c0_g1~~TRINITY_DN16238_c0_g1_i3.p1  ORF type:complete len:460 (-),score=108.76 TRINITY_DN16238_c0_g1_i3:53-1432(-)
MDVNITTNHDEGQVNSNFSNILGASEDGGGAEDVGDVLSSVRCILERELLFRVVKVEGRTLYFDSLGGGFSWTLGESKDIHNVPIVKIEHSLGGSFEASLQGRPEWDVPSLTTLFNNTLLKRKAILDSFVRTPKDKNLIVRDSFEASELYAVPLMMGDINKKYLYDLVTKGRSFQGKIEFSRWRGLQRKEVHLKPICLENHQNFYEYKRESPDCFEWHVNFADPVLFIAYGTGLFAQDEVQVAEHPILAHLKEMMNMKSRQVDVYKARTKEGEEPTPILIKNVDRLCSIATNPSKEEGRPDGLYGKHFEKASKETIERATQLLDPPTKTNLICMAALPPRSGYYTFDQIDYLFKTALTAFTAAKSEANKENVVIETGNWGCGAFGGRIELMALVQILAASASGIHKLIYHSGDARGTKAFQIAQKIATQIISSVPTLKINDIIDKMVSMKFLWGMSNGT